MTASTAGAHSSSSSRRMFRPNLRQATLILPRTGERVKRVITLRDSIDGPSDDHSNETSPLLRRRTSLISTRDAVAGTWESIKQWTVSWKSFVVSDTGISIFKCSLAYFLGSLATLVPGIANLLGSQDGKHMVATVTVYFHPARAWGSMLEASMYATVAFVYATLISVTSMAVSVLFGDVLHQLALGHAIILIVFVGGGLGFVAWLKQRLGDPLVNVACSLASLASITVLTKEGAVQAADFSFAKIYQVLKMVIMGVLMTLAVCLFIFPLSARAKLRQNFIDASDALGDMFTMITRSFLLGSEEELTKKSFVLATEKHKKVFASLPKNLKEAKYEHYVVGSERESRIEAKLAKCVQRLSQCVGGLRSAALMQFTLLKQSSSGATTPTATFNSQSPSEWPSEVSPPLLSPHGDFPLLSAIDEVPEEEHSEGNGDHRQLRNGSVMSLDRNYTPGTFQTPPQIFSRFISYLGPSMKSLAYTLRKILDELPYSSAPDFKITVNAQFRGSLHEAIDLYSKSRQEALSLLYKHKELRNDKSIETEADFEEVAASCGYFSFSLLDFAEQLKEYLDIVDELDLEVSERPLGRTWNWLKFWRKKDQHEDDQDNHDPEQTQFVDDTEEQDIPGLIPSPTERQGGPVSFDAEKQPRKVKIGYKIWAFLRVFRRHDIKFAIKVGIGAALYALPAFITSTRPFYSHWRGEWGLLSYMLVCSMTIGAANTTGYSRFIGTCMGAAFAILAWYITGGNVYALGFIGWLMSLWTAYIIIALGNGPMGRFIMLTYNLSALYTYSLSVKDFDNNGDEGGANPWVFDITLHRVVAVLSGCLWGLIVTRVIWPISARQRLKDGLSILWLRMGLIWKGGPLSFFLDGEPAVPHMNLSQEFELQRILSQLESLRVAARSEFELRGPFPDETYGRILASTSRMLDAFHAMNVEIMKNLQATEGESAMLRYTVQERAQLGSRISHLFSVLASSMKLEYPLNDAFPNTDHTRDRLLAKIYKFRKYEQSKSSATDSDFALLYAYVLVTSQLSIEIQKVIKEVEDLFGVLNEDVFKLQ